MLKNESNIKKIMEEMKTSNANFEEIIDKILVESAKQMAEEEECKLREATEEEERILDENLKILEGDVNRAFKIIGENKVSRILNSTPTAAYFLLVMYLNKRVKEVKSITDGEDNEASISIESLRNSLADKAYNIEKHYNSFINVMAKLGLFIMKLASIFLGLGKFALDTLAISVTLVVRVGYSVTKELVGATKGIGRSFSHNVLKRRNSFNVDKYVDDDNINNSLNKNEEIIKRLKAKLNK